MRSRFDRKTFTRHDRTDKTTVYRTRLETCDDKVISTTRRRRFHTHFDVVGTVA